MQRTGSTHPSSEVPRGGRSRDSAGAPAQRIRALTTDLWYTVIYYRPTDQLHVDRARDRIWTDPLVRAGLPRARARRELRRIDAWATRLEVRGRTPSIFEQARWLEGSTRIPMDGAQIAEALDGLIARSPVRIAPGASRALAEIRQAGVPLGLVSNLLHETGRGARELLEAFGILGEYSVTVFSDEHPWSKPGPEPFRFALSRMRVPAAQAAHVGDLSYDVIGATRAGMGAFLYTGLHRFEPPRLRELALAAAPGAPHVARWSDLPTRVLGPG